MNLNDPRVAEIISRVVARLQNGGAAAPQSAAVANAPAAANDCWTPGPRSRARRSGDDPPLEQKWRKRFGSGADSSVGSGTPVAAMPVARPARVEAPTAVIKPAPGEGVYDNVDAACKAAQASYEQLCKLGFNARFGLIEAFRKAALENLECWSIDAATETKMGRAEDKILKNRLVALKTPGPEFLQRPEAVSGSDGLTVIRLDPWGVIASVSPCTNSTETVINNGIGMISAGNAVVFNPHPLAKRVSADCVRTINRAIAAAGGPKELLCCVAEPTIESAHALMAHPLTPLVLVTGGGAVVQAAMKSGKRAICAGPGNPPAVVDETACPVRAARSIVYGASLDNNVVCTDEKEAIVVASAADRLKAEMLKLPVVEITGGEIDKLTELVLAEKGGPGRHGAPNKKMVGKNPSHILRALGRNVDDAVRLVLVDVDKDHPLVWTEQLMPVFPICRVPDADAAIRHAAAVEDNRRHTASIHSERLDRITKFANALGVSICVANASNYAGLGMNGEGYTSFSISTPTGEGLTTARTFCRERRLALCAGALKRA